MTFCEAAEEQSEWMSPGCRRVTEPFFSLGEATQRWGDQQDSQTVCVAWTEAQTPGGPRSGGTGAKSEPRCGRAGTLATGRLWHSRQTAAAVSAGVCSPNARQMLQEWWL